jgi:phosphoenolpyruvate-protein phosphotransferase (PTS system enzyme I)
VRRAPLSEPRRIDPGEVAGEAERLQRAAAAAAAELRELAARVRNAGHDDESEIFDAHAAMALDPALAKAAVADMEQRGVDAVGGIVAAAADIAGRLAALDDELFRARANDVIDVGDRIARHLSGLPTVAGLLEAAIVVGEDVSPSVTATLPRDLILGIALERSSPTAHAAILARAYGIPAVVGATGLLDALHAAGPDAELAIDGSSGEILVAPEDADRLRFDGLAAAASSARARDLVEASVPARTVDGVEVSLLANIGTPDEAEAAVALGAKGVGLFRTEFLFLERARPPSEDEQTSAYRRVIEAFPGQPVTIRLLDVGGDKPIPYLQLPAEDNPFLGVRALRLAERQPELFITQLRACYRAAAAGTARVMAPMVADATDVQLLLGLAHRARSELEQDGLQTGTIELGVMLETPSAVLAAPSYFGEIGFASIGTNDLLQYALAVDRGNPALERYRDAMHPALLSLVAMAVEAAGQAGIPLSVCGEMAGDAVAALALLGLGVRSLSMSAPSLPGVRRAIRNAAMARLAEEASAACGDRSAAEARARFTSLVATVGTAVDQV